MDDATASNTGRTRVMNGKRFERRDVDVAVPKYATDAAMHVTAPMTWYAMYCGFLQHAVSY